MGESASWDDERQFTAGIVERSFRIRRPAGTVPGTVWTPIGRSGPVPLVLLGHGGSGHRRSDRVVSMVPGLARAGYATAAIDGPFHGERMETPLTPAEYQAKISAEGIDNVLDRMAGDWVATRDLLVERGIADPAGLAYFGLSMASRYGLAAAADLGPGLRCAVFGKFGTRAGPGLDPGLQAPDRALRDAARITAPVLFHVQWDDEVFPRDGQFELFDAFPSPARELRAYAGGHRQTPEHAPAAWLAFIERHVGRP